MIDDLGFFFFNQILVFFPNKGHFALEIQLTDHFVVCKLGNMVKSTCPPLHLTGTEDTLRCQIVSQLSQVGILPVVQLPASDAQVEPQPRRVGLPVPCPGDFVVAPLLTHTLPSGEKVDKECESMNGSSEFLLFFF